MSLADTQWTIELECSIEERDSFNMSRYISVSIICLYIDHIKAREVCMLHLSRIFL